MRRLILDDLIKWKDSRNRKPLIMTGVRQCGKTYVLKEFGTNYFENYCYINFESNERISALFDFDFDVYRILNELESSLEVKITTGKTLLIFDEIQACPRAITSLKYFCENAQDLHIVAAGSLLGVTLQKENISFPVGKVNRLQMFPMSFKEFIIATGNEKYLDIFKDWSFEREIPSIYSESLTKILKDYYVVGGMPEAVSEFVETHDYSAVQEIQNNILIYYESDFSKHAPITENEKLRMIWNSIPTQLAKDNNKFVFSHVSQGLRAHQLEAALQWLKNAGLVHMLTLVQNAFIPLSAYADATFFKLYMSDIGLLCRRLNINYKSIIENNDSIKQFMGAITENYVLNELICQNKQAYFWNSGNTAKLDFLFENENKIYPLEVKSSNNTQAKSYKMFCKKYRIGTGFKASLKNIASNILDNTKTISLPLYLLWNIDYYIS